MCCCFSFGEKRLGEVPHHVGLCVYGGLVFFPSVAAGQKESRAHAKPRCGR